MQKIYDTPSHKWFVEKKDNALIFRRKSRPVYNQDTKNIFSKMEDKKDIFFRIWIDSLENRIIKLCWKDKIEYEIFDLPDSEIDNEAFQKALREEMVCPRTHDSGIRAFIKNLIKNYYSLATSRNRRLKNL